MLVDVPRDQAEAILGAMRAVALAHGPAGVSDADRRTIDAAAEIVFALSDHDLDSIEPLDPDQLAAALTEEPELAVRMLAVMSLVDGKLDAEKNSLVDSYAQALDVDEAYLPILTEAAEGEIAAAAACIVRKNAESFPHLDLAGLDVSPVARSCHTATATTIGISRPAT